MELAPRPKQNGYARIAYNIFMDMDNQWLSRDELWELMPNAAKADKKAKSKLTNALSNGEERGLWAVVGESKGNKTNKKYRIATLGHRQHMMKKYNAKMANHPSKKDRSVGARSTTKLNGVHPLVRKIEEEIAETEEKLARLERMRNDALTL
jgi:hypothetical protein